MLLEKEFMEVRDFRVNYFSHKNNISKEEMWYSLIVKMKNHKRQTKQSRGDNKNL